LNSLGVVDVLWDDVVKETTEFMVAAYGGSGVAMSECRQWLWVQKTARAMGSPKLCSLPPTTEAFVENMKMPRGGHLYTRQILEPHGPKHSKMQRNDCYQTFLGSTPLPPD